MDRPTDETIHTIISAHGVAAPREFAPGVRFDDYELCEKIGRGGMGEIWRARDLAGMRDVAIKFVPPDIEHAEEEMERVQRMFQQVHGLQHQHICPLYVMKTTPGFGTYIVMKFIPGMTLAKYANKIRREKGGFSLETLLEILKPVADALDYAHSRGVVHRDIKPGNIMVCVNDAGAITDVQLIDFGLAATFRASMSRVSQQKLNTSGTRPYMAPEQWRGAFQDAATDQYALGVTAYELLTGIFPFDSDDVEALRLCVLNDQPEPIPTQPDTVNAALGRALAKERKARFARCADFVAALAGAYQPEAPSEAASAAQPETQPWSRRADFPHSPVVAATADFVDKLWNTTQQKAGRLKQKMSAALERLTQYRRGVQEDVQRIAWFRALCWRVVRFFLWTALALAILSVPLFYMGWQVQKDYENQRWESMPTAQTGSEPGVHYNEGYNGVNYVWRWCPPGEFIMGDASNEGGQPRVVKITDGFWILDCEVTQQMWEQIVNQYGGGWNPSIHKSQHNPVDSVTWDEAQEFCRSMSLRFHKRVTLPTEAEWEYACRAGSTGPYPYPLAVPEDDATGAVSVSDMAWYADNSGSRTHPVREKSPNAWGIYDMNGNVREWCQDWYDDLSGGTFYDPTGPSTATGSVTRRVVRGGDFTSTADDVRCFSRDGQHPQSKGYPTGFRVVMRTGATPKNLPASDAATPPGTKRSFLRKLIFSE